jgi:two-component system cell cycle sensor histidine kinase/response regulator CckA
VVSSELERGSTFTIYLPAVDEPVAPPVAVPEGAEIPRGSETILVVEDEESVRALARKILERNGYTVLEAGHAEEALLTCARHAGPIHLVVTDVVMPGVSGRELAERLLALHSDMRVLFVSGYIKDAIVERDRFDPGRAFLQKPFTREGLARKVREILQTPARKPARLGAGR